MLASLALALPLVSGPVLAQTVGGNGGNGGNAYHQSANVIEPGLGGAPGLAGNGSMTGTQGEDGRIRFGNIGGLGGEADYGGQGGTYTFGLDMFSGAGGGAGGAGGAGTVINATQMVTSDITGGAGGNGGNGLAKQNPFGFFIGGGGGGGGGGSGLMLGSQPNLEVTIGSGVTVAGGQGGQGGAAGVHYFFEPSLQTTANGYGGQGGYGISAFSSTGTTIQNQGTIRGGDGGLGGVMNGWSYTVGGIAGSGGYGVVGANLTIENSGVISGGTMPSGGTNTAIVITGGTNSITTLAGGTTGGIWLGGGHTTLAGAITGGLSVGVGTTMTVDGATSDEDVTGITTLSNGGTISVGPNRILSAGAINNGGTIAIDDGAALRGTGNTLYNTGTIVVGAGGHVDDAGDIENVIGAAIRFNGPTGTATLSSGTGNIINDGEISVLGGDVAVSGNLTNRYSSTLLLSGGDMSGIGTLTLQDSATIDISSGRTLSVDVLTSNSGTLVGAGTIDASTAFNLSSGTVGLALVGDGVLTKTGSGAVVLAAENTYAGGTTISAGTLQVGNGGTTGSITGDVVNDSVLSFNRTDTMTYGGAISGSGAVQQIGTGTTILTGSNSYTGDTLVSGGTLQFGNGTSSASSNLGGSINVTGGALAIQSPATLNVAQTVTLGDNTALSITAGANSPALSASSITIGNGVAFNLSGIADPNQLDMVLLDTASGITGDFANVSVGGFGGMVDYIAVSTRKSADNLQYLASYGLTWNAGNNLADGTFTLTNATDSFTVGTALADQAANPTTGWDGTSLTKAGAGTLILTAANTYSGGSTINGGTLQLGSAAGVGSILGAVTVGNGAAFGVVNADTSGIASIMNNGSTFFLNSNSAGSATITNFGLMNFNDTSTAGNAAITNNSGGSLAFNHTSTAGSATITNNSALHFRDTSTAGSAAIVNGGYVYFNQTSTAGSAAITNTGNLQFHNTSSAGNASITNNSNLVFYDASTAGNATITNSDDIIFLNTSTAGTATITNNAGLDFLNASTAGSASITNNSTLNFSAASTAGSATISNILSLNFNDIATAGSAAITNDSTLNFNAGSTAGAAIIDNNGFQNFYQTSTAGNASINNYNELRFHDSSTAGSAIINNVSGLYVYDASTMGDATITNNSLQRFYHISTAGNAALVNPGLLEFYDTSTAGSATITNIGIGYLRFDDNSTAGSAALINNAYGTVEFSGMGPNADGRLSAGSIAGAGDYFLGASELTVGSNNLSTEVSGVISGTGSLVKVGTGTLTLSGTNTYTGSTRVLGGLLKATGTLAGTIDISAGGKVGGNGTLGTVNVGNGGIVSPGNSIGAVTIATLSTGAGASYDVELIDGGNTPGVHNDLINVTGVATINLGLTIRVMPENGTDNGYSYAPGTVYTVLATTAPGNLLVNGAPDVSDSFAFLNFAGSHDTQNFYLTSQLAATSFCQAGSGANQCGAGDAAFALGWGNGVFDAMLGLGQDDVAGALASISGEAHASVQSVIDQTFAQLGQTLTGRGSAGVAALKAAMQPLGYVARPSSPGAAAIDGAMLSPVLASAWLTPLGGRGRVAADANAAALDWWHGGLAGGYEVTGENALTGLAFGYQRGSASVAARQSQTSLDSFMLGTYGALTDGANALAGALTLGTSRVSTNRMVTVGGLTNEARAEYWTQSIGLSLEASHDLELGNGTTVTPLATLSLGWSGHGGFTETGAGAFNLTAAATGAIYLDAGIGLGLSHVIETEDGALTISARAVWEHGFAGTPGQSMTFSDGTTPFTIRDPTAGSDRLRLGAGLAFEANDGLLMGLDYDGSFSAGERAHKASASIGVQF